MIVNDLRTNGPKSVVYLRKFMTSDDVEWEYSISTGKGTTSTPLSPSFFTNSYRFKVVEYSTSRFYIGDVKPRSRYKDWCDVT